MLAVLALTGTAGAQTRPSYMHGQNVSPAYEDWERDECEALPGQSLPCQSMAHWKLVT